MRILLFGGSGQLGKAIAKCIGHNVELLIPTHDDIDIRRRNGMDSLIASCDLVIHAAAFLDNKKCEAYPEEAIDTNIGGTVNIAAACLRHNIRLVYISTDYVYPGDRGNYLESDPLLPFNLYAWTKLGGECAVRAVKNHLIIRTSFGVAPFPYPQAFVDKWSSKDYVDVIALKVLEAALSPLTGVLNLGTHRKTLYEYAVGTGDPEGKVKGVRIEETNFNTPYDTSLNLQKWIDYKQRPEVKTLTVCRCCESDDFEKVLDLGLMPLNNNLAPDAKSARNAERYPLQVLRCQSCQLLQLSVVVDPVKLFSYYTYRSGINVGYKTHCRKMADWFFDKFRPEDYLHIDIAGNDGTLIREFREASPANLRYRGINVDPASNLTAIAEAEGVECITAMWSMAIAKRFEGKVNLITATNVFAHVDDISGFLKACYKALDLMGVIILEFPYIVDFIEQVEFDTVYFEHLSYVGLSHVHYICKQCGLSIIDVTRQDIHGGTLRVVIGVDETYGPDPVVAKFLDEEIRYLHDNKVAQLQERVQEKAWTFRERLLALKQAGKRVVAFAASAKGNTMLNYAGVNTDLVDYIMDETPEKIGKFSPGTGIPIVTKQELLRTKPDYVVILSWNFAEEIKKKLIAMGYAGQFI